MRGHSTARGRLGSARVACRPAQHRAAGPPGRHVLPRHGVTPAPRARESGPRLCQAQGDVTWCGLPWTRAGGHTELPQRNHRGHCQCLVGSSWGPSRRPSPGRAGPSPCLGRTRGADEVLGCLCNHTSAASCPLCPARSGPRVCRPRRVCRRLLLTRKNNRSGCPI